MPDPYRRNREPVSYRLLSFFLTLAIALVLFWTFAVAGCVYVIEKMN